MIAIFGLGISILALASVVTAWMTLFQQAPASALRVELLKDDPAAPASTA